MLGPTEEREPAKPARGGRWDPPTENSQGGVLATAVQYSVDQAATDAVIKMASGVYTGGQARPNPVATGPHWTVRSRDACSISPAIAAPREPQLAHAPRATPMEGGDGQNHSPVQRLTKQNCAVRKEENNV